MSVVSKLSPLIRASTAVRALSETQIWKGVHFNDDYSVASMSREEKQYIFLNIKISGNCLVVQQWLGLDAFTAMDQGSIPGGETKVHQALW